MRYPLVVCLMLSLPSAAVAADLQTAGPLRLEDVMEEARDQNPSIQAAHARARAAAAVPRRVIALDDPMLSYEGWNAPESLRLDQADNNIFRISQKIPFPGKRTLAGAVAERDADVARREADAVELDVIAAVKEAYYELWKVHQDLLVYSREKDLVQRFASIAEQRYGVGEVSQSDVLRAQVELTRLINRVTTQTLALDRARADLNALLSRESSAPLGTPQDPPLPRLAATPEALTKIALERRPEIAGGAAAIAREKAALDLARRNYLPDFEFAAARFINSRSADGFGAFASVTIPIAFRSKYDAAVAEASARHESAQAELRRQQDRIRRDVTDAFVRARTALLQHDLFVTTHIPQTEQALRVTESGYQAGSVDFLTLIDTARALEAVHIEHFDAAAEFEKALAALERAVGMDVRDSASADTDGEPQS